MVQLTNQLKTNIGKLPNQNKIENCMIMIENWGQIFLKTKLTKVKFRND